MKEYGTVLEVNGNKATVLIKRSALCGDCGACQIGREKMTMETVAQNNIKAKPGDPVMVEMQFISVLGATMIAYGIPLLAFLAGALIGWFSAPALGIDQVLFSFLLGLILTVLVYVCIYFLEKKGAFKFKYQPTITELAPEGFVQKSEVTQE